MKQKLVSLRIERAQPDLVRRVLSRSEHAAPRQVEKMTSIRQEMGPTMRILVLRGVQRGHGSCGAAAGGDAVKACVDRRSEQDVSLPIPCAATAVGGIAQSERSPAREI